MEIFTHAIQVREADIDELRHVNNVVYLQWVQDAAEAHWLAKAPAAMRQQFNWVVLRHEIDYKSPALPGDRLEAKTWVENYEGARSLRVVQLIRASDSKLLAEARTTWCLLNAQSGRPTRITEEMSHVFLPGPGLS